MPPHRPSTIDRLPNELRELIGSLRKGGRTIDEIRDKLLELDVDVSRSALGRHVKSLAVVGEEMRRSREMATALVSRFGEEPDDKLARLNLELMHSAVFQILTAAPTKGDNGEEAQEVTFKPGDVMFLAKALGELSRAAKTDADRIMKIKADARAAALRAAAEQADAVGKKLGWSAETARQVREEILGVKVG